MTLFGRNFHTKLAPVLLGLTALVILLGALVLSTTYSSEVLAQTGQQTTSGDGGFVICGNTADNPCKIDHLFIVVVMIINYLIAMAGLVALLFIIIAGVQMTASRGESSLISAKQKLSGAVIGIVIVGLSFVLVNSLFTGSLSLGIRDGGLILTNPKKYINLQNSTNTPTTTPTQTPPIISPK